MSSSKAVAITKSKHASEGLGKSLNMTNDREPILIMKDRRVSLMVNHTSIAFLAN